MLFLFSSFLYALEVGDLISNTAMVNYKVHGIAKEVESNTVTHTLSASEAEISFLYATQRATTESVLGTTAYRDENGELHVSETTTLSDGTILGNDSRVSLEDTGVYGVKDTAIIQVTDLDQNIDRTVRDYLEVTISVENGDKEVLRLIETGPDTGLFLAYIALTDKSKKLYDNQLYVVAGETIVAEYDNQSSQAKSDSAVVVIRKEFKVWMEKQVNKSEASVGELLSYSLTVHNDEVFMVRELRLTDALPLGLKYRSGTAKLGGKKVSVELSEDGKSFHFLLPELAAHSTLELSFLASVTAGVHEGKIVNQTWVEQGESFKSNVATVLTTVKEELMRSKGIIVGQVYDQAFDANKTGHGVAGVRLYLESGVYVLTDQAGKYHFEGVDAGRHIVQVDKALLPKGYVMGSCQDNARFSGNNFSQFVSVGRGALKRVDFCLLRNSEKLESKKEKDAFVIPTKVDEMPNYTSKALNKGKHREILWPPEGYVPFIPSMKMAIKHPKNERIEISLNDYFVSKVNYDGSVNSKNSENSIELYRGVDLLERSNLIRVKFFNKSNKLVKTLERKVHVSSTPVQAIYVKENSHTVADGKVSPVIAVKFLDDAGHPLRSGMTGTFSVEAPYSSQEVLDQMQNNPLAMQSAESKYTVHSEGIAYIKLQPTTASGEVMLHFNLQGRDEVVRAWLKPALREWIMVGFAEGTVGFNKLSGHKESLDTISNGDKTIKEGRVSFFAKGKVKGDWLLTMAYDSGKETKDAKLFSEIDPEQYYTLYGDSTQQYQEAASRKKLYVKVEKEQFNLLFGDFNTDLTYTELSAYSRSFTGVKGEFHGENLEAKAFVSNTEQLFVKDEIRGDGTSGYYYLKSKNVISFTEKVTIEVRNRYRAEEVVERIALQRFKDYEIDYTLGRIYFNEPIFSNDEKFNPRYIVVDYEVNGDGGKHYTYGGRTAVKTKDGNIEVGASYISEDSGKKRSTLQGTDVRVKLGTSTQIRAEYAKTKTVESSVSSQGEAKLAEIEHISNGIHARAYYREQESAFGLGQLSSSLGATRKVGLDFSQQFENRLTHQASIYRESDLLNNINSDVLELRTQIERQDWGGFVGYRYAKRSFDDISQQILLGASKSFFDQRLKLRVSHEESISDQESTLFPTKTGVGLDYALSASMDLFSNYEWASSYEQGRVGVRFRPWTGMSVENTTLSEIKNDSQNVYNTLGALQSFQLSERVSINVGLEEGRLVDGNSTELSGDFHAYHLGMNYNEKLYSANFSAEFRDASDGEKLNLSTALYTQANDALALAVGGFLNLDDGLDLRTGERHKNSDTNLRLSMAYRPDETDTIVLEKLDYVASKQEKGAEIFKSEKLINNLNLNLTPTKKSELSLQHGIKYVKESVDEFEYKGITQLFGLDTRYDLTKNWELGLQGSWLYAQSANNSDYGFGVYSGHNLFDNMLLTVGYNWQGFEDQDFSLQTYRMEGAYFRFNMKFDQESLKDTVEMMSW